MVAIEIKDGGAYLVKEFSKVIFLSGGFGSRVNDLYFDKYKVPVDSIQSGSEFRAPLEEPQIVKQVHKEYADADVDVLTADTFNASESRQGGDLEKVTTISVAATDIAQEVAVNSGRKILVAASLTSSGDCYTPDDTPENEVLEKEHTNNVQLLAPHADFILAETLPTLREAAIIADKCQEAHVPFITSVVVNDDGDVLDGSTMEQVVETVLDKHSYCMGITVNCGDSIEGVRKAVKALKAAFNKRADKLGGKHYGAYPNGFKGTLAENEVHTCANDNCNHDHHDLESLPPDEFADLLEDLVADGATIVGGCCGTTKEHAKTYVKRLLNVDIQANVLRVA